MRKDGDRIRITAQLIEAATENLDAYEMYLTARELFIRHERFHRTVSRSVMMTLSAVGR